jgi:hypothetical protein
MNSRAKGNRGELAAAEALKPWGRTWRRRVGQSQQGEVKPPDLVMVDPPSDWHAAQGPEVKYGASVNLRAAWAQAVRESGDGPRVPWVLARRVGRSRLGRRAEGWVLACAVADWHAVWAILTGSAGDPSSPVPPSRGVGDVGQPWAALARGQRYQRWAEGGRMMLVIWLDDIPMGGTNAT